MFLIFAIAIAVALSSRLIPAFCVLNPASSASRVGQSISGICTFLSVCSSMAVFPVAPSSPWTLFSLLLFQCHPDDTLPQALSPTMWVSFPPHLSTCWKNFHGNSVVKLLSRMDSLPVVSRCLLIPAGLAVVLGFIVCLFDVAARGFNLLPFTVSKLSVDCVRRFA